MTVRRGRTLAPVIVACLCLPLWASTLKNPTNRAYDQQLIRLKEAAPGAVGTFVVKEDGRQIPYQTEEIDGQTHVWVCSDFEPGQSREYTIASGRPRRYDPKVTVRRAGSSYVLDNGRFAVKVPAKAASIPPGPVAGIRLPQHGWVGESFWKTSRKLRAFHVEVVADGTLFARICLRYEFEGTAGLYDNVPAFAEFDITLGPGRQHVEIRERHEMSPDDYWELDISKGWSPRTGISQPFSKGAGSGLVGGKVESERPLLPGGLPYAQETLFINMFPRWNQHYKDGWYFSATDGESHLGATVVSASQWGWPHNNAIKAIVKPSGTYAGLRCSTWKGRRTWWLSAPTSEPRETDYIARYAWEDLDKLNHDFILGWPGRDGSFSGMNFYNGNHMNPSSSIRGAGRRAIREADKEGNLSTLYRAQVMLHPDAYGSYWHYWSPENPNFFTDFFRVPIAMTARLTEHPQFEKLRTVAEQRFREDMFHSITLPGGASQECPGYVGYALRQWNDLAPLCRKYFDFDPTAWPRYKAAQYFQKRSSQPDGDVRRMLPMGDTHPGKDGNGPKLVDVPAEEVRNYRTEELPGFGVIFTSKPGTGEETYLAFKSGPNRGHYHGDQLAFHYCANAGAVAVDHHCSYKPRAGQEHMHNRVAFHTEQFPYANMDGYERVIAFETSPLCDIAVGQVESERLRKVEKLPPEIWHQEFPQHTFESPLIYRRTIVLVKGGPADYFVIRDQFWAPEPLSATYCLHVLGDKMQQAGRRTDFEDLTLFCAVPSQYKFGSLPWSHDNGGRQATQGARLTIRGKQGQFITVLYPGKLPETAALADGVRVGADEIRFAGDEPSAGDSTTYVTVRRNGRRIAALMGEQIDLNRSQGDIGLFVPDAGYPFGRIPDWLIRQRSTIPDWAPSCVHQLRRYEQKRNRVN